MKKFLNALRFVRSRLLYFLLGIFLVLGLYAANAAWNPLTNVNPNDPLTANLWNNYIVNNLNDLNARVGAGSSSQWTTSAPNIYYNTGNVGIGTPSPGQKLSVAGTIESTIGGFKFPDGTTQTTAAGAGTSYYMNMGEDFYPYWNTDGGGTGYHAPHADSCPGADNTNPYVCQPNENIASCLDSAQTNSGYHHRRITCRSAKVDSDPGTQKMTAGARWSWEHQANRYIPGANNGACSLADTCGLDDIINVGGTGWRVNFLGNISAGWTAFDAIGTYR